MKTSLMLSRLLYISIVSIKDRLKFSLPPLFIAWPNEYKVVDFMERITKRKTSSSAEPQVVLSLSTVGTFL